MTSSSTQLGVHEAIFTVNYYKYIVKGKEIHNQSAS